MSDNEEPAGDTRAIVPPPPPNLFVLSTASAAEVLDFYREVAGWELQPVTAFPPAGDADEQVFIVREGPGGWTPFLPVPDLPEVLERARVADVGRVVHPLPGDETGRTACVFDPSGTRLGLYQVDAVDKASKASVEFGRIVWLEQKTRDQDGATTFYADVFGFSPVGPTGPGKVRVLMIPDGPPYAGVMEFDERWEAGCPSHWLLYQSVENVDQTIERAIKNGGSVWFQPSQTPIGRLAYLRDPAGNAFAIAELDDAARSSLGG